MVMDNASRHSDNKTRKWENIIPFFQPPYSPELNPVENMRQYIRENGGFKNTTFNTLLEVEDNLEKVLKEINKETVKEITLFNWINDAI
jgi:transposase